MRFDTDGNITGSIEWIIVAEANGANPRIVQQPELPYGQYRYGIVAWSPAGYYKAFQAGSHLRVLGACTHKVAQAAEHVQGDAAWKPGPQLAGVPTQ
jgi:hypothetical protein